MELEKYLRRNFSYDEWANREALRSLREMKPTSERAVTLLAHIIAAQILWLKRLHGGNSDVVWPSWDVDEIGARIDQNRSDWQAFLDRADETELRRKIDYMNSRGEKYSSTVLDVITHVLFHSAYHRGQIALAVREAGSAPPYTDFIHPTRTGILEL